VSLEEVPNSAANTRVVAYERTHFLFRSHLSVGKARQRVFQRGDVARRNSAMAFGDTRTRARARAPRAPRNIFKDEQQAAIYTRVARLIKRSQSKPKLIAAAARCGGTLSLSLSLSLCSRRRWTARCSRAKSAVISASESVSRAQVDHCAPCTGLTAECGLSAGGSAVPFKPQSTPCIDSAAAGRCLPLPPPRRPPACRRPFERSFCRDFAFRLSRSLGCISPHRTRVSSEPQLLPRRIKARR